MQFIFSSSCLATVAGYFCLGAEKMVQKLKALACAENTGWSPSTPMAAPNHVQTQLQGSNTFFCPLCTPGMRVVHR